MNPVLVNTDGRVIQRFEECDDNGEPIEGKYTYCTLDAYDKRIANAGGEYRVESVEEAKSLVREQMTQAEILDAADQVAAHVVRYGAGDREESSGIKNAAESYLMGRGKEMPEEYCEEEEGKRRTPECIVTLRIKASTLPPSRRRRRLRSATS